MNNEKSVYLDAVQCEPPGKPRAAVIWLHGLGADGHDFEPVLPALGLGSQHGIRFVFPHAPAIPVTINGGMVMPAWYDIAAPSLDNSQDEAGIRRSAAQTARLIERENQRGIPSNHIVLAGFSQGGAIALFQGLRHPEPLAGIVALSTYLVLPDALGREASPHAGSTPVFQAHGEMDPMVPLARGEEARDRLQAAGYPVSWHTYPMPHAVCPEEIVELGRWLGRVLPEAI